jgi:hypothetical protein
MSDTPETNSELSGIKAVVKNEFTVDMLAEFARRLERERDEARDQCSKLRKNQLAITRAYDDVCERLDKAVDGLKEISKMDTSQDAGPQQCGAVLIAMNTLEGIE